MEVVGKGSGVGVLITNSTKQHVFIRAYTLTKLNMVIKIIKTRLQDT